MQEFVGSGEFAARFEEIARAYNLPREAPRPVVPAEPLFQLAQRSEDTATIATLCETVLALDPSHRHARFLLAHARERMWRPDLALAGYDAALALAPDDTDALFRQAMLLGRLGCHAARLAPLRRLVSLNPAHPQNWFELGHAWLQLEMPGPAMAALSQLGVVRDPYWLSVIEQARRARDDARRQALVLLRGRAPQEAAQDAPQLARLLVRLGRGRAGRALLRTEAPDTEALHALHLLEGDLPGALAVLRQALPARPGLLQSLVQFCLLAGDFRAAHTLLAGMRPQPPNAPALRAAIATGCPELRPAITHEVAQGIAGAAPDTLSCQAWLTLELAEGRLAPQQPDRLPALAPPSPQDIPFRVFQYWNSPAVPPDVAACIASWRQVGGAEHVLFDDAAAEAFLRAEYGAEHARAFLRCYHPAMRSDFIRIAWLHRHGGIYTDADERCLAPLWGEYQSWKHAAVVLVPDVTVPSYLHNWFIAARPGTALLQAALQDMMAVLGSGPPGGRPDIWQTTGPGLITRAFVAARGKQPVVLLDIDRYRRICGNETALAYKATAEGNWRLAR
ncbi:hypothetical protein EOD42_18520 [Rhodovarius crocodyli]|uniref:Uncharacterized protein n=2 Tax=Rhodovarius crocodyli TaxID=1979269 RepID=A0A437M3C6_9PROT|nr:hypothetical protein EOD42_18520 [Rhodovarius crocodyli]